jgi:hypothetical protein
MRRSQRLIASVVLIALAGALAGCSGSLSSFDPTDLLDFLDTKKKMAGDRKPVFPDGVPGLEQGVPKELYRGSKQEQIDQQNARTAAAAPPPEQPVKRGAKSRANAQPAATAGTAPAPDAAQEPDPAAEEGGTGAAPPPPKPKKIVRKRTTAPPPDQPAPPAQSAPSAPQQQSAAPFPAPMPSGNAAR